MSVPSLEDYGISPITGFLPEDQPQVLLPEVYAPWLFIAGNLSTLIKTNQLRAKVDSMPVIDAGKLHSVAEQRRAYSILAFLAHAYVWSPPATNDRLPQQIAEPLLELSSKLGVPPLATYAGLVLWNYKLKDLSLDMSPEEAFKLSNISALTTYTGEIGETWFYCVSVFLEKSGGPSLSNGMNIIKSAHANDSKGMIASLNLLAKDIVNMTDIMMSLYENLDANFFYNTLRPFLAGWKGMEKNGLPDGVYYGDEQTARKYAGGSNGQSSLIQALDIILNVQHHATGTRIPPSPMASTNASNSSSSTSSASSETSGTPGTPGSGRGNAFLMDMRNYMPKEHREFLEMLEEFSITRKYVVEHAEDSELTLAYDNCIKQLRDFRSKHIQVVMRYISLQSRKQNSGVGLAMSKGDVGTGGTELMPFLKQTRDEVTDTACGDWARSIVSSSK